MMSQEPVIIEYHRRQPGRTNPRAHLVVAWICGLLPLLAGIAIFVGWLVLRADVLEMAGLCTIGTGLMLVVYGTLSLIVYLWRARQTKQTPGKRLALQACGVLALYLANFMAAAGAVTIADEITSRCRLWVVNQSNVSLTTASIDCNGVVIALGNVAPGTTAYRSFHVVPEKSVVLSGSYGNQQINETLYGYVIGGMDTVVIVNADGTLTVQRNSRP